MANNADNLFAPDGFFWWVGVVEDRQDPLKLGRCRVRILGYHTTDQTELPRTDLPWAMPLQPILSAAISGKGHTPLGPLEGTWVMGFFADGRDSQQPIIWGTIGAIPTSSNACLVQQQQQANSANAQRDNRGNIVTDGNGGAVQNSAQPTTASNTASNAITSTLPPLSQTQIQSLMDAIAAKESSSVVGGQQNYGTVNTLGYVGKYQFGVDALVTQGYVRPRIDGRKYSNADLNNPNIWTGKADVNNVDEFLSNKNNVQETAMYNNISFNYGILKDKGVIDSTNSDPGQVAGYLAAAHLGGAGGAANYAISGANAADSYGTRISTYYALGNSAVGGASNNPSLVAQAQQAKSAYNSVVNTLNSWAGSLNAPALGNPPAYSDPNSVYPKCDYTNRQDTNQLATNNDALKSTPQPDKTTSRLTAISTANNATGTWDQPASAYNAKYPYNHVKETESGHVVEFDDTPNAERIHVYHKSGTFVEIDKFGTVNYTVKGDHYQLLARNNRVYVQGVEDVTIEGAKTLQVKNTLDVEVYGKTTIVIRNDCDVNVAGDLNIKAYNINMEAQKNFNIKSGVDTQINAKNYINVQSGGDTNINVGGDATLNASGAIDIDGSTVNINSGGALGLASIVGGYVGGITSGLSDGVLSDLGSSLGIDSFAVVGTVPLGTDIANPFNSISKTISSFAGNFAGGIVKGVLSGNLNLNSVLSSGGIGALITGVGIPAFDSILQGAGYEGGLQTLFEQNGLGGTNVANVFANSGIVGLEKIVATAGLHSIENIMQGAGVEINGALGNVSEGIINSIVSRLNSTSDVYKLNFAAGDTIIDKFKTLGAGTIDITAGKLLSSIPVDATEFASWTEFPAAAQLSKFFNLGDLSDQVHDVKYQNSLIDQAGLNRYEIITNLKNLAVNSLDPIKTQYPTVMVNNAFTPTLDNMANNLSDNNTIAALVASIQNLGDTSTTIAAHLGTATPYNRGQAANLHFAGATPADYFSIAQWIKDNVAYDQLRLEYTTFGNGEPWIGIVQRGNENRSPVTIDKIVTTMNGKVVANYLVDLTSIN